MKVLFYLKENKLAPKGGPYAVGYYYREEDLKKNKILDFNKSTSNVEIKRRFKKICPKFFWKLLSFIKDVRYYKRLLNGKLEADNNIGNYDAVHFHVSTDMFLERKNLSKYKGVVIFQSHSPLPLSMETYANMSKAKRFFLKRYQKKFEEIDKFAFSHADYIVFPCPEAEQSYIDNWDYYKNFCSKNKDRIKYVITGVPAKLPTKNRDEIYQELGIKSGSFVISFAGRHNFVKGYDILKKIGEIVLNNNPSFVVIAAGLVDLIPPLKHNRWIEIGWTNDPQSFIFASDVFVLPNRVTYFDIVMLEVLSLGKIVVASRTGGNNFFAKMGLKGVFLYDTVEEAVEILEKISKMDVCERKKLGEDNKNFYLNYLTTSAMYDSYVSLLTSVIKNK